MKYTTQKINSAFFGSSRFSVLALDELERLGFKPALVITTPDKPQGRKLTLTPTPVKTWALERKIPVLDPAKLDDTFVSTLTQASRQADNTQPLIDVFVVASYGKIIPKTVIDIPTHKTLNIHPSLLPKYRGASPLQSAILDDAKDTGVSIMVIDELMDHGPIIAQEKVHIEEWPTYEDFEALMAVKGAALLASILEKWVAGKIAAIAQDHTAATHTKKISKRDATINLSDDPYLNFRKIQAYHEWPQAHFFIQRKGEMMRVKITDAAYSKPSESIPGMLTIRKVIPDGGKEMDYGDFKRGYVENGNGRLKI